MRTKNGLLFLTWLGAAVRWPALLTNHFHADEALFASWARLIAVWRDPLLQTVAVDKPPLLFYLQAFFYPLQGPVEWAARLPSFSASILLIPLVGVMVQKSGAWGAGHDNHATGNRQQEVDSFSASKYSPWLAAGLVALSPLAIQFSATAFIDPLLTFLVVLSLWFVLGRRPWAAGLMLGLALASKYQAALFVPLLVGCGWLGGWSSKVWARSVIGVAAPLAAVVLWDVARSGGFGLWSAQMNSFGGVRLAWSWELWPRLKEWVTWGWYVLGWGWLLLGVLPFSVFSFQVREISYQRLLGWFVVGYMLVHWLLAIPVWDRYLVPLVPLVSIWMGLSVRCQVSGIRLVADTGRLSIIHYSLFIISFFLFFSAVQAAHGRYPIGSTAASDGGAAKIAAVLQDAPYGTVLYDHWYSWHWRYHFFDTGVYVSWFPDAGQLIKELQVFGTEQRYVVLPAGDIAVPIQRELQQAGFALVPLAAEGEMVLYTIREGES